ncbi:hypothetical protein V4V36_09460 [Paenibacillus lautus]|jgi:hypothetical protein|uniref:hypothetical protein n=1 Tax=Paenibacillus lautus TaxID=1401 RepID=UPI0010F2555B|nr:hypothetical protein [Paenibacillus lautus]MBY0164354.1 hypothetical protein [Cytobacillus firmus]MCI1772544.1 hypothetical protein [Paenibacillus lautus]VTR61422.1 Uncharacterised protein [Actinobacillus pleuropneumoniae]
MLVVIALLQLIMIGILLNINSKLKPRDYIADAMERDRRIREEREKKQQMEQWSHEASAGSRDHS